MSCSALAGKGVQGGEGGCEHGRAEGHAGTGHGDLILTAQLLML